MMRGPGGAQLAPAPPCALMLAVIVLLLLPRPHASAGDAQHSSWTSSWWGGGGTKPSGAPPDGPSPCADGDSERRIAQAAAVAQVLADAGPAAAWEELQRAQATPAGEDRKMTIVVSLTCIMMFLVALRPGEQLLTRAFQRYLVI